MSETPATNNTPPTPNPSAPAASNPATPNPASSSVETSNSESFNPIEQAKSKLQSIFGSWKVKAGIIGVAIAAISIGFLMLSFFWSHIIASRGMSEWSSRASANPIECMIKDTNNDGYVSCSAMLKGEVVPLECGSSIFNIGCRVNYGAAAAPTVRQSPTPANRM
jgi:hypothetical protein